MTQARAWLQGDQDFRTVVWTDEKRFCADGPDSWCSWWPADKKLVRNRRQQGGFSVQVWGALVPGPYLFLLRLENRMNSEQYINFFETFALPHLRDCTNNDFILQQDQCPTHISAYSRAKFAELGVELLPWPSRSPDLNIIENIWSMLSNIVYDGRQFEKESELWAAIDAATTDLNCNHRETMQGLFDSIPRRFLECVELKGAKTNY